MYHITRMVRVPPPGRSLSRRRAEMPTVAGSNSSRWLIRRAEQESKRLLSGFRDRLSLPPSTHEFVQTGIPGPTIVQKAKEWPADLIVIASHGRSGVPRALLGSVAEEVIRNAPCPVLVVRAQT
jgi:nucleotide-binding universal stress UspA family protein